MSGTGAALAGPQLSVVRTIGGVREHVRRARSASQRIALVPTMGALHAGHLALVDRARAEADWIGLSIFVNPLQFGPAEDLDRYPRDLERDANLAAERGVDLLFAPTVAEMYPDGEPQVTVAPGGGADRLCGASRPGHFGGVLTVAAKLFGIFEPDVAVFGQKDFQQASLIRRMVHDLSLPVRIAVAPIVRDGDGLALSSRNAYLSPPEREQARALSRGIERTRALFAAGEVDADALRARLRATVAAAGARVEYADCVDPDTLQPVARAAPGTVCLVAAHVGTTRLIDNVVL